MTTKDCKNIRQRIDQAELSEPLTDSTRAHLRVCEDCRQFEAERNALRELMAGLGPVAAPSDFDFRLKARLARETSQGNGTVLYFLKSPRPIALAALLLLVVAAGGLLMRNWIKSPAGSDEPLATQSQSSNSPNGNAVANVETTSVKPDSPMIVDQPRISEAVVPRKATYDNRRATAGLRRRAEKSATREMGLTSATIFDGANPDVAAGIVRVPLNEPALRISIDNGKGALRMVSLPTVSFGSQRLTAGNSFVPVSSSRGTW